MIEQITDLEARKIASEWAEGGDYLQQLASTGAITPNTLPFLHQLVIEVNAYKHMTIAERTNALTDLFNLIDYVFEYGPTRGPQEGWANLTW